MSRQKAVHTIKHDYNYKKTNNGKTFILGTIIFLCGKKYDYLIDPDDKPLPESTNKKLPQCKKCLKLKGLDK